MNVYAYYAQIPGLWTDESQRSLIEIWRRSWSKHGWNPIVIAEEDAMKHPRYADFKERFWSIPTPWGPNYGGHCFMRWAAMSALGGGMLVDYDVINYGFQPREVSEDSMEIFCDPPGPVWCGAILGSQEQYEFLALTFYEWPLDGGNWLPDSGTYHGEDQVYLRHMLDENRHACPNWLRRVNGCTLYPDLTGPLVHYTSAVMLADKKWPKCEHVESLRAI